MLQVDLARLRRQHRLALDEEVPPDAPTLGDSGIRLAGPLHVTLDVQEAGGDVVVRGELRGRVALECRRCLKPVDVPLREAVAALYSEHVAAQDDEDEGVYPLPSAGAALGLDALVREGLILGAPRFALCDPGCRGMCPRCGADLNEGPCGCEVETGDPRWATLRNLKLD